MKIAILTFYYGSENYGAVLQAYALNKYLSNRFPDTEVHTMSYSMSENNASQFFFHELKNYLSNFLHGRFSYDIRKFKFAQFRKKIPHTKFCNPETVSKIAKDYDIIIAGSDQIWNPHFCNDRNYFLPFDCKTISYAASVGESNLTEGQLEAIKAGLAELDYISVREKADEILFSKETDRCITTVLDPTLLLRKEDYIQLFGKQHNDVPYTVFYILGNLDRYTEIIARVVRGG